MGAVTWLDVMPAIPLADYLGPVRTPQDPAWKAVVIGHDIAPDVCHVVTSQGESEGGKRPWVSVNGWLTDAILRPDLDDPQGFAYALRFVSAGGHGECVREVDADGALACPGGFRGLLARYLGNETRDYDRHALAIALRGVTRG